MGKIEISVKGAYQVVKNFADDKMYIAGQSLDIKDKKLASELSLKGLIEEKQVEVKAPVKKRTNRKSK